MTFNPSYFEETPNYPDGYKYDEIRKAINQEYYALLRKKIVDRKKIRILDIGCGFGYFLKTCDENNWETYGVDFLYALSVAKRFTRAQLICQSAENPLPFSDEFFDIVTTFNVIEHLKNTLEFSKEAFRILKPNGMFVIETPNTQGIGKLMFQKNWTGFLDKTHVNLFSPKTLKAMVLKAGFTRIRLETRGLPYQPTMRPTRTSITRKNAVAITAKMYKMFKLPFGLGDHIFAYGYK